MKKIAFILAATVLLFVSACTNNKKNQQNNNDVVTSTISNSKGESMDVTYNAADETATIVFNGETIVLKQQPSASGIRYANNTYEYTEWQNEMELTKNGEVIFSNKEEADPGMTDNFVDADGKVLSVVYDTSGETPIATATYEEYKNVVLTQIPESAWAKGAEYENKTMKMKWITTKNGGTLTIDGKSIAFDNAE